MDQTATDRQISVQPLRRYAPGCAWDMVETRSLQSPAPDGTVVYYQDALSKDSDALAREGWTENPGFDPEVAEAVCRYLTALAVRRGAEIADGPLLQILEDDGAVPPGWVMLRALIWIDEYDLVVEVDPAACADAGLTAVPVGSGVG